jgi:hypothetical protein
MGPESGRKVNARDSNHVRLHGSGLPLFHLNIRFALTALIGFDEARYPGLRSLCSDLQPGL